MKSHVRSMIFENLEKQKLNIPYNNSIQLAELLAKTNITESRKKTTSPSSLMPTTKYCQANSTIYPTVTSKRYSKTTPIHHESCR